MYVESTKTIRQHQNKTHNILLQHDTNYSFAYSNFFLHIIKPNKELI